MDMQSTKTATASMNDVLARLDEMSELPPKAQALIAVAVKLMKGRAIVQKELNGALAINLSEMEHLGIILKDGPSEQQRDDYRDFVELAEKAS